MVCILDSWSEGPISKMHFLFSGRRFMESCDTCKWLEDLPFADTSICTNEDVDEENNPCPKWEPKERKERE